MFAEPIYVKAYQRGVFQAAQTFCDLYSRGQTPAREWPRARSEATSLVRDLAPCDETLLRRLTSLAHAGSKIEWRHLTEALVRKSGIFLRVNADPIRTGKATVS